MNNQELTQLMKAMEENQNRIQNDFIDSLAEQVELLCEKANRKDYAPTDHERKQFAKIHQIINDMYNWF